MCYCLNSILQTPAAYVPLDPEAPGLHCAGVMNQCGLQYCAVKTDLLQVVWEEYSGCIVNAERNKITTVKFTHKVHFTYLSMFP